MTTTATATATTKETIFVVGDPPLQEIYLDLINNPNAVFTVFIKYKIIFKDLFLDCGGEKLEKNIKMQQTIYDYLRKKFIETMPIINNDITKFIKNNNIQNIKKRLNSIIKYLDLINEINEINIAIPIPNSNKIKYNRFITLPLLNILKVTYSIKFNFSIVELEKNLIKNFEEKTLTLEELLNILDKLIKIQFIELHELDTLINFVINKVDKSKYDINEYNNVIVKLNILQNLYLIQKKWYDMREGNKELIPFKDLFELKNQITNVDYDNIYFTNYLDWIQLYLNESIELCFYKINSHQEYSFVNKISIDYFKNVSEIEKTNYNLYYNNTISSFCNGLFLLIRSCYISFFEKYSIIGSNTYNRKWCRFPKRWHPER